MVRMPGKSFRGEAPPLDDDAAELRDRLRRHVERLAGEIGERNLQRYPQLQEAAAYIAEELEDAGYEVSRQTFTARDHEFVNLEAELRGASRPEEIVIVGAHYDTVPGSPGAGDNASGVAAMLSLARRAKGWKPARTVRFVAFSNEEMPYFQSSDMGSWVYARRCRKRDENIVAMLSLETIGYFRDEPGSQQYPPPFGAFYPSEGNFIGVIGNVASRPLVHRVIESFRRRASIPSEGGAIPADVAGVGWSDHWSFWQEGYPAVMITDTAIFRYPHYHRPTDTPDKLDYEKTARVVEGVEAAVRELAGAE
ncbi:MAG: M20/M25/M40 family metallo-hydrolase [Planctomycetes bacterium]|nr:M20/M25/M40 family metallo-hydrolase [Planctomycetota bacterium]